MSRLKQPDHAAMRHVNAVYHRLMVRAFDPGSVRFVPGHDHYHTDAMDTGLELCVWCATHQKADRPHLDYVVYEAICEQACVSLDGETPDPDAVASKLASASQRKAVETALGERWHIYLPAAYALCDETVATVSKRASQIPPECSPSHTARQLGYAVAAEVMGLPTVLSSSPALVDMADKCARVIESAAWPMVTRRATYTRTMPVRPDVVSKKRPRVEKSETRGSRARSVSSPQTTRLTVRAGTPKPAPPTPKPAPQSAQPEPKPAQQPEKTTPSQSAYETAVLDVASSLGIVGSVDTYLAGVAAMNPKDAFDEIQRRRGAVDKAKQLAEQRKVELDSYQRAVNEFDSRVQDIYAAYSALIDALAK